MPVLDYLRRWILGEDEEPELKFAPVPSFSFNPPEEFPSEIALENLGTDVQKKVLTGPVDDRPRIGPARPKTTDEKLAEIRSQTGVPESPVITGPGDLAREQFKLDQEIQAKADPIFDTAWDKASELGSGIEDASMQGLQEIALHPQGLFGDAPARLVGSMLSSDEVGPDGMPLRDEEGRLQGFPLKKAVTDLLDVGTFQRSHLQPDIPQLKQEGLIPGVIQGVNETVGEALTDPSDILLGAATAGLGGAGVKALAGMQFPAMADSAKGAYENFQNLPNKGLNTETGEALAQMVTQGAMAGAAGKQLGHTVLEPVSQLYGVEGPKFDPIKLTDAALEADLIKDYGSDPTLPNLGTITTEREARANPDYGPHRYLPSLTDEEVVALDRYTDGLSGTYGQQVKERLKVLLNNLEWGHPDSPKFKLLGKISNKLEKLDVKDPLLHNVLAYGYEGVKEMDPSLRDPILRKIARAIGNDSFIPDNTTWPGDPNMAKIYLEGVTGKNRYDKQAKDFFWDKQNKIEESIGDPEGKTFDYLSNTQRAALYTKWRSLAKENPLTTPAFHEYLTSLGMVLDSPNDEQYQIPTEKEILSPQLQELEPIKSSIKEHNFHPPERHPFIRHEGSPGISVEKQVGLKLPEQPYTDSPAGEAIVYRDKTGKNIGYLTFRMENGKPTGVEVFVSPEHRGKGIASQLYDAAKQAGYDLDSNLEGRDFTEAGAGFMNRRRQQLQELDPTGSEPIEEVNIDELVHTDVPTPSLAEKAKLEAVDLLGQAREGKIADQFAAALETEKSKKTQNVEVDPNRVFDPSDVDMLNPSTAKAMEIATVVRDTLARLGLTESTDVRYGKGSDVDAIGYVRMNEGKGSIYFSPELAATATIRKLVNNAIAYTPENIVNTFLNIVTNNMVHESLHQTSGLTHAKKKSTEQFGTPIVSTDELGNLIDLGGELGSTEDRDFKAREDIVVSHSAELRNLVRAAFKDQITAQDVIDLATWKDPDEQKRAEGIFKFPKKIVNEPLEIPPTNTSPDSGPTPPAPSSDPLTGIRNDLRDGKATDFNVFINSLPDDLKSKGPDIWKEALSDPDKVLAGSKTPAKTLINLVNMRYPSASKDAQMKIFTRMVTSSTVLSQEMKNTILAHTQHLGKFFSGKPSGPSGPSGTKPPSQPPAAPTPNRFVKSSKDYIKYNQAIPVRQDQVAQNFEHLPKGLDAILAYEQNPQAVAPDLANFFDKLYKEQKDAGVQVDYTEDYLHHAYDGTPEQLAKYREWLNSQSGGSISLKPGHTLHRMFDSYQQAMQFGLKPKFNNLADIAALYYGKARRAILDAELVNYLKTTIDPKTNEPMLSKIRRPGYSPIVNFPGSRVPTKNGYVHVEYYAPTEIATQVNNFHSDAILPLKVGSGLASKARNLMLGAGIPGTWINMHGLNIENRFAMSGLPDAHVKSTIEGVADAFKMLQDPTGKGMEEDLSQSLEEIATMIEKGGVVIRPRRFYFAPIEGGLQEALGKVVGTGIEQVDEALTKIPGGIEAAKAFGKAGTIIEHLFDKPLFERMVPYMMKQRYFEHFTDLVNQGMDEEQAHLQAGDFVNTMFGADNWQASTNTMWNNPNLQASLQMLILAPQWFGSNVKMAKRIPESFFGNTPEAKMYRGYAKKFMTLFILGQLLGAGGTGGSEFQIPAGDVDDEHERQIRPFGTSQDWARLPFELLHKAYTRGNWDEAAKLLRNRMHPFVRSGLELITGQDLYTKQQLFGSNVPEGRKLLNLGKVVTDPFRPSQVDASFELLKKVTPLGDFSEENNLGRVKTLEEIGYDFTEAPIGVYRKKKPTKTPPFELFNFRSQRKKSKKKRSQIEAP